MPGRACRRSLRRRFARSIISSRIMLLLCVQFCVGLVQPVQVQLCVKRMLSEGARTFLEGTDTRFRARAGPPGRQRVTTLRKLIK